MYLTLKKNRRKRPGYLERGDKEFMKCEECSFCKNDDSIKEFVCSIEPDLPVVFKDAENNCEKANPIIKNK